MPRLSPSKAVVMYAYAVEAVREKTRLMASHPCQAYERAYDGYAGEASCWYKVEAGECDMEDVCDNCQIHIPARKDRTVARKDLQRVRRLLYTVGKRERG
jgi:hypothetical protein